MVVTIDTRGMAGCFAADQSSLAFFVFPLCGLHSVEVRPRQTPTVGYNATGPAFFLSANMPEQMVFWVKQLWATSNGATRIFGSGGPEKWVFWPYSAPPRPYQRLYKKQGRQQKGDAARTDIGRNRAVSNNVREGRVRKTEPSAKT